MFDLQLWAHARRPMRAFRLKAADARVELWTFEQPCAADCFLRAAGYGRRGPRVLTGSCR
jgi:hypothetical protein